MKSALLSAVLVGLALVNDSVAQPTTNLEALARAAIATNRATASNAIQSLRAAGTEGFQTFLTVHADAIQRHTTQPPSFPVFKQRDEEWERVRYALDQVSQQRDCFASRLYWFTDFEQAQAAARASGKPILSLRLLGNLNEEFSCANSRFFRTTLYANTEVAAYLREHFVLHWKSVRPAPRITIDFGDGRKLERTITGNSVHYVLLPDGAVVDALPGLYGAKAFLRGLERAAAVSQQVSKQIPTNRNAILSAFHRERIAALEEELQQDLSRVGETNNATARVPFFPAIASVNLPSAIAAAKLAAPKGNVERPLLKQSANSAMRADHATIDDALWQKIALLHAADATLDAGARKLIEAKGPNAFEAGRVALAKSIVENPLLRRLRAFERSISEDTVRNEYQLHQQIHEWLATSAPNVDDLNRKVYADLFLTPDSDPWLGLLPSDSYSGLEDDGLSQSSKR